MNESRWYTVTNIDLIEDFDPDQYGNLWYNAKLAEVADTVMWLAKTKPEEHSKVYGHLEKTQSGKRYRFKKDQVPEGEEAPAAKQTTAFSGPAGSTPTSKPIKEMYVSYAKDVYVAMYGKDGKVSYEDFKQALSDISVGAQVLMSDNAIRDILGGEAIDDDSPPELDRDE